MRAGGGEAAGVGALNQLCPLIGPALRCRGLCHILMGGKVSWQGHFFAKVGWQAGGEG